MDNKLVVFQDKKIRRLMHEGDWYYSAIDIIEVLSESPSPRQYWAVLKTREPQLLTICLQLKLTAEDGKSRITDCVNTKNAFRLIQSIPSKKAEPFKRWLAELGKERIDEIENPELAQDRVKHYYELKGYPKEWIDKRLRGIAVRQELTSEWKNRGIAKEREFGILTDEISKATFDKTVKEYKELKQLDRRNQNLRDHMTDWELILTMVGEKATTDITVVKDAQGFVPCKDCANEGGTIAKNTREQIEKATGKQLVSGKNYLHLEQQKKIEKKNK